MIQFSCTACKKSFNVPDRASGRGTNCPHCGQRLLIPIAAVQQATVKPPLPPERSKKPAKPLTRPGKIEGAVASKQVPVLAPTDQEEGWHPALWGLIGGIGVAVTAFVIGILVPRGEKPGRADVKQEEESARQVAEQENARLGTEQAPRAKPHLSAELLFAQASPGVVTITCKNDLGEMVASGSGFFVGCMQACW